MADIKKLYTRANQLYQKGRLQDAKKALQKVIKLAPQSLDALNMYGITLAQLGEFPAASDQFSRMIKLSPDKPDAYENLARVYMRMKQFLPAQTICEQGLKFCPDSYGLHFGRAAALMSQLDYKRALEALDRAKAIDSTSLPLFINMGTAYSQQGMYDDAITAFQQALSIDPGSAEAFLRLGQLYVHTDNFQLAEEALFKANQIKSDDFNIHLSLAEAYQYNQKDELALKHYYAADRLVPKSQNIYTKLDNLILHNGSEEKIAVLNRLSESYVYEDFSEAIEDAKKLVELTEYHDVSSIAALHQFFDTYKPDILHSRDWWQQQLKLFGDVRQGHDKILRGIHSSVFSWSLPDEKTLTFIADFLQDTPLYSYGAGSALWERLLSDHYGIDVTATDFKPRHSYLPITAADYSKSRLSEHHAIFLAWVIRGDTGILNILNQFKPGQKLVLIGEPPDDSGIPRICATQEMFALLKKEFSLRQSIPLVSYSMLNDTVSLYVKK